MLTINQVIENIKAKKAYSYIHKEEDGTTRKVSRIFRIIKGKREILFCYDVTYPNVGSFRSGLKLEVDNLELESLCRNHSGNWELLR